MSREGLLIVFSAPSGTGKGTVCESLLPQVPTLRYSVSATTRAPRQGETEGVHYHYVSRSTFETMIAEGDLLEWAEVYGNYYGTPKPYVEETLRQGYDVLLEIDPQGALQVKEKFPSAVFVFLVPPSLTELAARIRHRGTETEEKISIRLGAARQEMLHIDSYDYVVVNDYVQVAAEKVRSIIAAEHCKVPRCMVNLPKWLGKEGE